MSARDGCLNDDLRVFGLGNIILKGDGLRRQADVGLCRSGSGNSLENSTVGVGHKEIF